MKSCLTFEFECIYNGFSCRPHHNTTWTTHDTAKWIVAQTCGMNFNFGPELLGLFSRKSAQVTTTILTVFTLEITTTCGAGLVRPVFDPWTYMYIYRSSVWPLWSGETPRVSVKAAGQWPSCGLCTLVAAPVSKFKLYTVSQRWCGV